MPIGKQFQDQDTYINRAITMLWITLIQQSHAVLGSVYCTVFVYITHKNILLTLLHRIVNEASRQSSNELSYWSPKQLLIMDNIRSAAAEDSWHSKTQLAASPHFFQLFFQSIQKQWIHHRHLQQLLRT